MSNTKLINLRTGEVHVFSDRDNLSITDECAASAKLTINFALEAPDGPWSLSFFDKLAMIFNGSFVMDAAGDYVCHSFRRLPFVSGGDVTKLIGKVVAYKPKVTSSMILYGDYAQEIGLASAYNDKPTYTVEFAEGNRSVDADDCFEATKDQQITYWKGRALNACSKNEDS